MSSNTAQSFVQQLSTDSAFRQQLMAAWGQNRLPSFEEFTALASQKGYTFEATQLIQLFTSDPAFQMSLQTLAKEAGLPWRQESELSMEDLDWVAGGGNSQTYTDKPDADTTS
jgi:hypothetical protein